MKTRRSIRLTRSRAGAVLATGALGCAATVGVAAAAGIGPFGNDQVGQQLGNRILLPSNQWISPVGDRILVTNGRITGSTVSPDGKHVAALSWENFTRLPVDRRPGQRQGRSAGWHRQHGRSRDRGRDGQPRRAALFG